MSTFIEEQIKLRNGIDELCLEKKIIAFEVNYAKMIIKEAVLRGKNEAKWDAYSTNPKNYFSDVSCVKSRDADRFVFQWLKHLSLRLLDSDYRINPLNKRVGDLNYGYITSMLEKELYKLGCKDVSLQLGLRKMRELTFEPTYIDAYVWLVRVSW